MVNGDVVPVSPDPTQKLFLRIGPNMPQPKHQKLLNPWLPNTWLCFAKQSTMDKITGAHGQ